MDAAVADVRRRAGWKWLAGGAGVVGLFALARMLPAEAWLRQVGDWVSGLGPAGMVVYGVVYALAAVLFIPGSVLTIGAGVLFGVVWGTVVVSAASTVAAAVAFLIARYVARGWVAEQAGRYPKFRAVDAAIGQQGWKIVALLRLSPIVPYSLSNYLYGLTAIRFWPYVLASWVAMVPGTLLYVYLGGLGRVGLEAAAGQPRERSLWEYVLWVAGLLATVGVTVYVTRLARRALREAHLAGDEQAEAGAAVDAGAVADKPVRGRRRGRRWAWGAASLVGLGAVTLLVRPGCVSGLFGPPRVTLAEVYAGQRSGARFDHSVWDALLKNRVTPEGWVDYEALQYDMPALERYLKILAEVDFDALGRDEKLALLINAYNAFTVKLILDNWPVNSIRDIPASRRWKAQRWVIGGRRVSLEEIENDYLRARFREPRIHFAINCASVGCPPLRREAYTGERIDEQLEDQTRRVHAHERWLRVDRAGRTVYLTRLYDWYRSDFEQVAGSVLAFAARYSDALANLLKDGPAPTVRWLEYDWSLNDVSNSFRK